MQRIDDALGTLNTAMYFFIQPHVSTHNLCNHVFVQRLDAERVSIVCAPNFTEPPQIVPHEVFPHIQNSSILAQIVAAASCIASYRCALVDFPLHRIRVGVHGVPYTKYTHNLHFPVVRMRIFHSDGSAPQPAFLLSPPHTHTSVACE